MKKCFDEGVIQGFLDGELEGDLQASVARHVAGCDACALALSEAEEETALAFAALDRGIDVLVPTGRLRVKINDSIERANGKTTWRSAFANLKTLFARPSIAAFAGVMIAAALFFALRNPSASAPENYVSRADEQKLVSPVETNKQPIYIGESEQERARNGEPKNLPPVKEDNARAVRASFVKAANALTARQNSPLRNMPTATAVAAAPRFVSGEETYVRTIAALEKTVNTRKDEVLKPSARFAYEKDLAVADDAIMRMKTEVKQNPKNEAAKQILLASYQNKVDLLSSVADKTELMASLK